MSSITQQDIDEYISALKKIFPPSVTSKETLVLAEISTRLICIDGTLRRIADPLEKEDA